MAAFIKLSFINQWSNANWKVIGSKRQFLILLCVPFVENLHKKTQKQDFQKKNFLLKK